MNTSAVIPVNSVIHKSEDYAFLREEGLKYIEQLSSDFWTDFNKHDPGVTCLEAICYAITDLGYRTSLPMKDLLAKEGMNYSEPIPPLFTARNILTNHPLTITDYRKILVDIAGVKNAWLEIANGQEVDFYADCEAGTLKYFGLDYKIDFEKKKEKISNAIKANIENPDDRNQVSFSFPFTVKANVGAVLVTHSLNIDLPGWYSIDKDAENFIRFINLDTIDQISVQQVEFNNQANAWTANIYVRYTSEGVAGLQLFPEVKVDGVRNLEIKTALKNFLESISSENPFFLYHQQIKKNLTRAIEHHVSLRGLWEVLLQFDVDDRYGDLNSSLFNYTILIEKDGKRAEDNLEISGPAWESIYADIKKYEPFILSKKMTNHTLFNTFTGSRTNTITTDAAIEFDHDGSTHSIIFENLIFKGISDPTKLVDDLEGIFSFLQGKLYRTYEIVQEVKCRLHAHRNLCEDFNEISSISVNEIGICADINLENTASLINTQAEIIFQIQQYISPSINFYSLNEMVDQGIPSEDIFDGPKLNHGFIIDKEIEASALSEKRFIYASDIINIIQDIPGVVSVSNLLLTKYDKAGNPILPSESWCLRIDPMHKAELSITKSKVLFFKEDLPYVLSNDKFKKMLEEVDKLRTLHERYKLVKPVLDFPVPKGTPLPLEDYSPVRFSLPQTYGIGVTGLPASVSPARKAKAKQLSAFLSFFDQLLGNYLSQLSNLGNLFSIDPQVAVESKKTYYNQLLSQKDLNVDFINPALLANGELGMNKEVLQRITESGEEYLDRRNRFLDHLLGRFAEDFTEYALMVFSTEDDESQQELIYDKAGFLEDYPTISSERAKAFAYKHGVRDRTAREVELWNTDNVPGLKKRVSKLLGMPEYAQQNLHCPTIRDEFAVFLDSGKYKFHLKWGTIITHTSPKEFNGEEAAFFAKEQAIILAANLDNYLDVSAGAQYAYQIIAPNTDPLNPDIYLQSETFNSTELRDRAKKDFYKRITSDFSPAPSYEFQIEKENSVYKVKLRHHNLVVLESPGTFTDEAAALEAKYKVIELSTDQKNYKVVSSGAQFMLQIGVPDPTVNGNLSTVFCETTQLFTSAEIAEKEIGKMVRLLRSCCLDCNVFEVLIEKTGSNFTFRLKDGTTTLLESHLSYATIEEALLVKEKVTALAAEEDNYTTDPLDENASPPFVFQLGIVTRDQATNTVLTNEVLAKSSVTYLTRSDALQAAMLLNRKMNSIPYCQIEGFHLIEHLLLRPRQEDQDDFFAVCLDKDCFFCGQEDPYSFRISAVFPYWTRKFMVSDPKLKKRTYVDKIIRQEAPAHVHLKVCWVNNFQMRLLDLHYHRWLEENAKPCPDPDMLTGRLNALLDILGKLRNRYPEAFLHDCDDSELENTVMLNKSFLGSYHTAEDE